MTDTLWWFAAVVVMAIGLLGTILPIVPGTTIILIAAIVHRIMTGAENGLGWFAIAMLVVLTALSYLLDFFAGLIGARRFGATKWGVIGAIIGGIAGIFTGFVTLLFLPIVGAIIGEMIGGKRLVDAGKAGWGTLLGNVAGMIGKLGIGLAMIVVFLMNSNAPSLQ
jgi:uncharacterized protein YqgC (DUF456 family)